MKKIKYRAERFYKKKIVPFLRKTIGVYELESNVYTLLNSATDITKCRPAAGTLREIQLSGLELLKLADAICRKEGLTYWLDWGTLIGAVRHKGFIPWDDDLDVCMPRKDFVRAIRVFSDYFADKDGFDVPKTEDAERTWMWINYWNAGIHLDIFPADSIDVPRDAAENEIEEAVNAARKSGIQAADIPAQPDKNARRIYFYPQYIWSKNGYFGDGTIFPLRELPFEQYSFFAPNDFDRYLSTEYGNYMEYPRSRILHHKELILNPNDTATDPQTVSERIKAYRKAVAEED